MSFPLFLFCFAIQIGKAVEHSLKNRKSIFNWKFYLKKRRVREREKEMETFLKSHSFARVLSERTTTQQWVYTTKINKFISRCCLCSRWKRISSRLSIEGETTFHARRADLKPLCFGFNYVQKFSVHFSVRIFRNLKSWQWLQLRLRG